ncbi:conjugative transposon protein TraK [[Flexibacter] sp. ATCC 35208]|uniref:conjugative transposon protein TraK n=1 Tax=[Flexibacter] sp. ATCC 35208 TaxID=1936242 RepID=UPI0009C47197|nr:conjugative transposon protein TraK [[Flexibacter] sp. ATCC 35208]OMP80090.1 conjugative transposon protein TraK [[Flexibacter] sp. ATCC 35208]
MLQQLKNIDSAFKHIRLFSAVLVIAYTCLCGYTIYTCFKELEKAQQRIYLVAGEKAVEAFASNRKDNIPVEAKDHIKSFHQLFFDLSPDEKVIEAHMKRALYLADESGKDAYFDLKEKNYFASIVSANVSQEINCDSVKLDLNQYPYYFRYYGTIRIIRTSAIITRTLITEGYLRNVDRSDNNSHGFLILRWLTLENRDISVSKR